MAFSPLMNNNYFGGAGATLTMRGPVSSSAWTISGNSVNGAINIGSTAANHAEKAVAGVSINANTINSGITLIANRATLTQINTITNNIVTSTTLTAASSSIIYSGNIGGITITNGTSGSATAIALDANAMYVTNNLFIGSGNSITTSGSSDPGDIQALEYTREVIYNTILGSGNSVRLPYDLTGSNSIHNTLISGLGLSITGSNPGAFLAAATRGGSAFVGRYNQQDGNRAQTAQTVFAVGTGTSTSLRKTGFLIDSGSNTFVEGTLNVSGSTNFNGNLIITGSLTASLQQGFVYVGNASGITTTVSTSSFGTSINTGSFATTGSNTFSGQNVFNYGLVIGNNSSGQELRFTTQNDGNGDYSHFNMYQGPLNNFSNSSQWQASSGEGNGQVFISALSPTYGYGINLNGNTFVNGIFDVSGSTSLTGSLTIQSGSSFFANGNKQFNVGAFQSNVTQSGSANVSQSMNFETTDISSGISIVSNSRITLANSGTYNIQFSAQVNAPTGADTIWIWLKKNGTNVSNTATKLVLANNEANVAAWNFVVPATASDYFELVWQNNGGHAQLLTEAAAGNYPAIPSIILTVTQVE
jgi:hypothetical protein